MAAEFARGDLVWFDPGIGYVLPGEVIEFHQQAQVRVTGAICRIKVKLCFDFMITFHHLHFNSSEIIVERNSPNDTEHLA